jgi:hypothetical protein
MYLGGPTCLCLIEPFELGRGFQLAVEMAVNDLHEEFAEVGEARGGKRLGGEVIDWTAEHAGGEGAGFRSELGAGGAMVALADKAVAESMEKGRLADQRFATLDALVQRRQEAQKTDHPEIEIGDGEPDGIGFQRLEDGPGEAEDSIVGLAVGQEIVEHFSDVREGDGAWVIHRGGQGGKKRVTGVEAGELAAFAVLPGGADTGEWLEGSAETLLRALGALGDSLDLAFGAGEEGDKQIGLAERVGAKDNGLGLLEGHRRGL